MSFHLRLLAPLASAAVLLTSAPHAAAATPFQGLWCGTGLLRDFSLKFAPGVARDQVRGILLRRGRAREVAGSVDGSTLHTEATRHGSLVLTAIGNELKITGGDGPLAMASGAGFRRSQGDACAN